MSNEPIFTCKGYGKGMIPGTPIEYDCGVDPGAPPAPAPAPAPAPPPPHDGVSVPWGLTRQLAGTVYYQPGAPFASVPMSDQLADILGGGTWRNYAGMFYAWWLSIATGSYVSFAFVPEEGALNLNANPTYGGGGVISVSSKPGIFSVADGAVCVVANGNQNNLSINGFNCPLTVGQTYYLNIASVTPSGTPSCWGIKPSQPQTCTSSLIAYTAN